MAEKRFTIQGFRDYRGVQLPDIIEELKSHRDCLLEALDALNLLLADVSRHREQLDDPDGLLGKIGYLNSLFRGHWEDLIRLVNELPLEVAEKHLAIIDQIYDSCKFEFQVGYRLFKEEYISRVLKDESMRELLDRICSLYGGITHDLLILSDINTRLKTFLGPIPADKKTIEEDPGEASLPVIELPPDTRWEEIKLIFLGPEEIQILVKGKAYSVKSYKALGFLDRRTNKETDVKGKPTRLWRILAILAKCDGELSWDNADLSAKEKDRLVKDVSDLRAHLQAIFRIKDSPIDTYDKIRNGAYKTRFQIALSDTEILTRLIDWTSGSRG